MSARPALKAASVIFASVAAVLGLAGLLAQTAAGRVPGVAAAPRPAAGAGAVLLIVLIALEFDFDQRRAGRR